MVSAAECTPSAAMELGAPTTRAVPLQQPSRRAAMVEASATDRSSSAASVLRMLVERLYPPQCVETAEISAIMAVTSSAVRVVLAVLGVQRRRFLFSSTTLRSWFQHERRSRYNFLSYIFRGTGPGSSRGTTQVRVPRAREAMTRMWIPTWHSF